MPRLGASETYGRGCGSLPGCINVHGDCSGGLGGRGRQLYSRQRCRTWEGFGHGGWLVQETPRAGQEGLIGSLGLGDQLCSLVPCLRIGISGPPFGLSRDPALDAWVKPPAELHDDGTTLNVSGLVEEVLELVDVLLHSPSALVVTLRLQDGHCGGLLVQREELLLEGGLEFLPGVVQGRVGPLLVAEGLVGEDGSPALLQE